MTKPYMRMTKPYMTKPCMRMTKPYMTKPYRKLPELLQGDEAEVVYVPTNEWVRVPAAGPLVAAKHVEYYYQTKRAASPIDEGMLLIAQALIFSRAAAVVGTLTSNYLLVVVELAELQRPPGLLHLK